MGKAASWVPGLAAKHFDERKPKLMTRSQVRLMLPLVCSRTRQTKPTAQILESDTPATVQKSMRWRRQPFSISNISWSSCGKARLVAWLMSASSTPNNCGACRRSLLRITLYVADVATSMPSDVLHLRSLSVTGTVHSRQ